ncbi:hypothetical protein CHS0354_034409 [Potamilus streckersoni]|uniref:C1q domain-containing protein n=1 Tax=Potamilus streckersoni TaxID=2493646 RepID=A0AAE0VSC3_9BIVA|nr:hypothetical protein CHS0354_034409 [Potamilus streckersoni]
MTPVIFALYLIFTCCTFSRTQSTATMISDLVKFVHEMSSELKKLKEEHIELRRIVQGFVGNQEEIKRKNSREMRLQKEENDKALESDLKGESIDRVEQLNGFKADRTMILSIQKDVSSIQKKLISIQNEQGMTRVWQKKMLMIVKELKLFERDSKTIQLKRHSKNGLIHDHPVFIINATTQRQDEQENEHDKKDEAEMVVGYDYINESEDRIKKKHSHNNEDTMDGIHGRKTEIKNRKESMIGIAQSKRTAGENSVCADSKKGMIRKSVSIYSAFTARVSVPLRHFANSQPIVFGDIYLNQGNGYDKNSGIFRAPVAGLYLVLITISSEGNNTPDVEVVKNGSPLCRVVVFAGSTQTSIGSPCNVLVQLGVGDEVWVRVLIHHEGYVIRGQYYSMFSMALLVPDQASGSSS